MQIMVKIQHRNCTLLCKLIVSLVAVTLGEVFYIIPSNNRNISVCFTKPCYTLHDLTTLGDSFLQEKSDTEVKFMPGLHELSEAQGFIEVKNTENLAFVGLQSSKSASTDYKFPVISCTGNGDFGLSFRNVTNICIRNIAFTNCSGVKANLIHFATDYGINLEQPFLGTIVMIACWNIEIDNVHLHNSTYAGLIIDSPQYSIEITNSVFIKNAINSYIICIYTDVWTDVNIRDSIFQAGTSLVTLNHQDFQLEDLRLASGLTITFREEFSPVYVQIYDVNLHNNNGYYGNLYLDVDACSPLVKISRLNSTHVNTSNKHHHKLGFFLEKLSIFWCENQRYNDTLYMYNNCYFSGACIQIVALSTVQLLGAITALEVNISEISLHRCPCTPVYLHTVSHAVIKDILVFESYGEAIFQSQNSKLTIQGHCNFSNNLGGVVFDGIYSRDIKMNGVQYSNSIEFDEGSIIYITYNRNYGDSETKVPGSTFYVVDGNLKVKNN